jgi:hypothetical protein
VRAIVLSTVFVASLVLSLGATALAQQPQHVAKKTKEQCRQETKGQGCRGDQGCRQQAIDRCMKQG